MKRLVYPIVMLAIGAAASWYARPLLTSLNSNESPTSERKILFYQSAMHPWVKSDKPGNCTICGMKLVPIYEGEKGFMATGDDVTLDQNFIQVLHVQTDEAKPRVLVKTLQVAGMVDDNTAKHRVLSAYLDGRVDALHVNFVGAEVEAGQPLADFYSPTLLQAEREYRQLSGELRNSTALRLRQMGLTTTQIEALPQKPSDALTSQILSPASGTVIARYVYNGQYVKEGDKLFELADFSTMWFIFDAYEQDLPWLHVGQEVSVTTTAVPGKVFTGKVAFIDPTLDDASRSAKVRVELENPLENGHRHLLHKLYADGAVMLDAPTVLTVPRRAIIETGPESVVYVEASSGRYERRAVKLGRRGDTLVEVLSGVAASDKVVTNGNLLIDGQAEMNRSYNEPAMPAESMPATAPLAVLSAPQQQAITSFVKAADALAAALARDDLAAFMKASEPVMKETSSLVEALRSRTNLATKLDALDKASHWPSSLADLHQARAAFHPFTMATTALLEPLRTAKGMPEFQVWECYMVNQILPEAPKKGHWVQIGGRVGQNPFFGSDMLDCAKEIKP